MGAPLPAAVRAFFAEHRLAGAGIVAVSGGADSVALLRALHAEGFGPLVVAHFHHGLRGAEADTDAAFVRELASALGCQFELGEADVRAAGGNLEATARRLRYDWLAGVAAATGAEWVATGHTADDQAETVLHRLVRGTGLRGLRGIAPVARMGGGSPEPPNPPGPPSLGGKGGDAPTDWPRTISAFAVSQDATGGKHPSPSGGGAGGGVATSAPDQGERRAEPPNPPGPPSLGGKGGDAPRDLPTLLVRPLLAVGRADVLTFLGQLGQPYRTDSTNADRRFTRNRIRAEVLPLLTTLNPDAGAALTRAAEQAAEAYAVIDRLAADLLTRSELPRAGELVVLDAATLTSADPLLAREAFRRVWEREGWPTSHFRAAHWHRLLAVANGDPAAADFPGGAFARRVGRVVQLGRRS